VHDLSDDPGAHHPDPEWPAVAPWSWWNLAAHAAPSGIATIAAVRGRQLTAAQRSRCRQ
jgi:hypothetical protein